MSLETRIDELKDLKKRIAQTTSLDDYMYTYIIKNLIKFDSNRTYCARALKISKRTLLNRLHQAEARGYDVPPPKLGGIRGKGIKK